MHKRLSNMSNKDGVWILGVIAASVILLSYGFIACWGQGFDAGRAIEKRNEQSNPPSDIISGTNELWFGPEDSSTDDAVITVLLSPAKAKTLPNDMYDNPFCIHPSLTDEPCDAANQHKVLKKLLPASQLKFINEHSASDGASWAFREVDAKELQQEFSAPGAHFDMNDKTVVVAVW